MKPFIVGALIATIASFTPQFAAAKDYKFSWKRTISSGAFDQETFFH